MARNKALGDLEKKIACDKLGFRWGTKTHLAAAMYLRREGATTSEISAVNGGPYLNLLKEAEAKGHRVIKRKVPGLSGRPVTCYYIDPK